MDISINDIMNMIMGYSDYEKMKILKAYEFAALAHDGQYRRSGDPYISHPLHVAKIVAALYPDANTICAALLHDTMEDCGIKYEELKHEFGEDVASLVAGVSKSSAFDYLTKEEQDYKYTRQVITRSAKDIRIIIIKLADRLHNMSTIEHKPRDRQVANAFETLHIYAPIANTIGAYQMKNQLEDVSFAILEPDIFKDLTERRALFYEENKKLIDELSMKIRYILESNDIPCEIKTRIKSIYSIYKQTTENVSFESIQDLLSFKILVDELLDCYDALHYIHREYNPLGNTFRDYISHPKVNKYKSLHSTVMVDDNVPLQVQIKTPRMDLVDDLGICSYWRIYGHNGHTRMQEDLKESFPFYQKIDVYDEQYKDDQNFIFRIEAELSPYKTYVYNSAGEVIELPYGSNIKNYLAVLGLSLDDIDSFTINGKKASARQTLQNDDFIYVKKKGQSLILK